MKCEKCGGELIKTENGVGGYYVVYMSNPPKYDYNCLSCGEKYVLPEQGNFSENTTNNYRLTLTDKELNKLSEMLSSEVNDRKYNLDISDKKLSYDEMKGCVEEVTFIENILIKCGNAEKLR